MHRTGSSLFANWLHDSGVFIGENLYGPTSTNKRGHFEDWEFLTIHRDDLELKGYHNSGLLQDQSSLLLDNTSINKAKQIIKSREKNKIWGWKEPRLRYT